MRVGRRMSHEKVVHVYECEFDCGFEHEDFAVAEAHEKECPKRHEAAAGEHLDGPHAHEKTANVLASAETAQGVTAKADQQGGQEGKAEDQAEQEQEQDGYTEEEQEDEDEEEGGVHPVFAELTAHFQQHAPEQLQHADVVMAHFEGREHELQALVRKDTGGKGIAAAAVALSAKAAED